MLAFAREILITLQKKIISGLIWHCQYDAIVRARSAGGLRGTHLSSVVSGGEESEGVRSDCAILMRISKGRSTSTCMVAILYPLTDLTYSDRLDRRRDHKR